MRGNAAPVWVGASEALRQVTPPGRWARTMRRMLWGFGLALVALIFVPWQQTATGEGRVIAWSPAEREQVVEAPVDGLVARWVVEEGATVRTGDLLVEIRDNDAMLMERMMAERATAEARLSAARTAVEALERHVAALTESGAFGVEAAGRRVEMARQQAEAQSDALDAAQAAAETARLNGERQAALSAQGLASTRTYELASLEVERTRAEADQARLRLDRAWEEVRALEADRQRAEASAAVEVDRARAALESGRSTVAAAEAELLRLETRVARQGAMDVRAPRDGRVARILARQGQEMVKVGDPLLVFVPDTAQRAVELWIDGNDLPLVAAGRKVRLQLEGWPAVQFAGWPSVAVGTFGAQVAFVDAAVGPDGRGRVVVIPAEGEEPWPEGAYLRQGVRAFGWVLLNQVTVGYELWRRLNGFPPAVPAPKGEGKG